MPTKNDVFFSAVSCKKDIIFGRHLFSFVGPSYFVRALVYMNHHLSYYLDPTFLLYVLISGLIVSKIWTISLQNGVYSGLDLVGDAVRACTMPTWSWQMLRSDYFPSINAFLWMLKMWKIIKMFHWLYLAGWLCCQISKLEL